MNNDLPLLSVFNNEIDSTIIRWCTPSIHPSVPRVRGIYENDISISYHSLGNPSMNTGIFQKAHELASIAYKSDKTLFAVNGSTGSNFIVFRALRDQFRAKGQEIHVLAQRNVHKSVSVAAEDFGIDITYIDPHYNNDLQIFVPNAISEILTALKHNPFVNVLFITNPTYEGLSLDLKSLVKKVRAYNSDIIIYIDEAWGAHFPFSNKLPVCAMEAGADICVQSTHKQGSGLQQTSMIHWKNGRIDEQSLMDSYKTLMTTSPSFHLLASLDGTRDFMQHQGEQAIDGLIEIASEFRKELNTISHASSISIASLSHVSSSPLSVDATKVLLHLDGYSGPELAKYLEVHHKIIVEKYEASNILFIVTFQNGMRDVEATVRAIKEGLKVLKRSKQKQAGFPTAIIKELPSHQAARSKWRRVPLRDAVGRVSAEDVVPYPPGIPIITKGEKIQQEHITYLEDLKAGGLITVVMSDDTIGTLKVIT